MNTSVPKTIKLSKNRKMNSKIFTETKATVAVKARAHGQQNSVWKVS